MIFHPCVLKSRTISYAYDHAGNVRFAQTQQQANDSLLSFNQYDDLNRLVVTGEAIIPWDTTERLTDIIDPTRLYTGSFPSILTANRTLWEEPETIITPEFWASTAATSVPCPLSADTLLGEVDAPVGPFLSHPVGYYSPTTTAGDTSTFESIYTSPQFVRMAISYDRFPETIGGIWERCPDADRWDSLAPRGRVRNLKGHEAVIAYREHGGEAYHYMVMSYDERGRVEALLRYTENLGFDAVYYRYNSSNQVTSVRVGDPLRTYTTWYGYNFQGQVDSVWTKLTAAGTGIGIGFTPHYPAVFTGSDTTGRPTGADIVYTYTKGGRVTQMKYPAPNVIMNYAYNKRKWLDSLRASKSGTNIFREVLGYDAVGNRLKDSLAVPILTPPAPLYPGSLCR